MKRASPKLLASLFAVVIGMFGFGYLLVPLYDVLCEITGLGGRTGVVTATEAAAGESDTQRWITIEFTGNAAAGLPWEFGPLVKKLCVHPGQVAEAIFQARNVSGQRIVGQAIPSVTPARAARYFNKTECFCFTQQPLDPAEAKQMPVRFVVDADLPKDIRTITLSYAFFDAGVYAGDAGGA